MPQLIVVLALVFWLLVAAGGGFASLGALDAPRAVFEPVKPKRKGDGEMKRRKPKPSCGRCGRTLPSYRQNGAICDACLEWMEARALIKVAKEKPTQ